MNEPDINLEESPVLVISDVHADPAALSRVLAAVERHGPVGRRCFLGDAIGYGEDPLNALNMLKSFDICIKGNHELLALGEVNPTIYSSAARLSVLRHCHTLPPLAFEQLRQFIPSYGTGGIVLYHGRPDNCLDYIFNDVDIGRLLDDFEQYDLFFGGHLHIPRLAVCDRRSGQIDFPEIRIPYSRHELDLKVSRCVVNVPSVTPGRMGYETPGACRLEHIDRRRKILEFIFAD